jgi:preprotein translocase subunit YajC
MVHARLGALIRIPVRRLQEEASWEPKTNMSLILLQSPAASNPLVQFLPILVIFGIFYFLLFLPMQRQKKQQQKMLSELKPGDNVLTNGGLIGTIVSVNDDDTIVLRVRPDGVKLQMSRGSVANVLKDKDQK